jgi:hypothetical protein
MPDACDDDEGDDWRGGRSGRRRAIARVVPFDAMPPTRVGAAIATTGEVGDEGVEGVEQGEGVLHVVPLDTMP